MTLDLQVHRYKTTKTGKNVLLRSLPYIRLRNGEEPPIFVQNGQFWHEGVEAPLDDKKLPKWVGAELAKISQLAKTEVGLRGDDS